jgi:hypothetical protein
VPGPSSGPHAHPDGRRGGRGVMPGLSSLSIMPGPGAANLTRKPEDQCMLTRRVESSAITSTSSETMVTARFGGKVTLRGPCGGGGSLNRPGRSRWQRHGDRDHHQVTKPQAEAGLRLSAWWARAATAMSEAAWARPAPRARAGWRGSLPAE